MRWITRVFVSAAVRRIAAICVLVLLGWLGIGTARAQTAPPSAGTYTQQSDAYAACLAYANYRVSSGNGNVRSPECRHRTDGLIYNAYVQTRACSTCAWNAPGWTGGAFTYPAAGKCSSRTDKTGKPWQSSASDIREGTVSCEDGCEAVWSPNGDGTATGFFGVTGNACKWPLEDCSKHPGTYWNPVVMGCEYPEPENCPAGEQKNAAGNCVENKCPNGMVEGPAGTCINEKNECPAGEVKSPTGQCLPGDGQCASGEARGKDGTCKRDSDGDGTPDNEDDDPSNDDEKESFSGGDNCNSPPACNGSPIQCGQARIQWRIECNTRRNVTITGGACTSMPICAGKECNAMEYSQLLQQWKAACALEKLSNQTGGGDGGNDPNVARIADALTGNAGNPNLGEDPGSAGAHSDESGYGQDGYPGNGDLDDDGFGYSRSCPVIPPVNVFGSTISFDTSVVCRWLTLGGQLVLVFAGLVSLRIMSGSNT